MSKIPKPLFSKDERCFCFHGSMLYEAKVLDVDTQEEGDKRSGYKYRVHYNGWKKT